MEAKAKAKAEAERLDVEMVRYELAAAEFYGGHRVQRARQLGDDPKRDERLVQKSQEQLQRVIDLYPDTQAAGDAKQILDSKFVPVHPLSAKPVLPKGITAKEEEVAVTVTDFPTKLPPDPPLPSIVISGCNAKLVYVRGYTRSDGVFVQHHYRLVTGMKKQD